MFINKLLILFISLVQGQYLKDQAISNGSRTGNYVKIENYPYVISSILVLIQGSMHHCFIWRRMMFDKFVVVSIRFAKSRKVICTGILITFSWVLSVPYCFMLTPQHYKRKQDSHGIIPPDIDALARKKSKSVSRRLAISRQRDVKNNRIREKPLRYGPFPFNETLFTSTTENPLMEDELNKTVIHLEPKTFVIIAGASSLSDCFSAEGQARTGERIVVHPEFRLSMMKQRSPRHELALLKTNMPFIEQKSVHKAPVLHSFLLEKNPSRTCKLVGWGRGKTIKPLPHLKTTISEISVQLFNSSKCRFIENIYGRAVWDDDEDPWFCSYDEENNAIPVCQSDSGAPLVCNDKVVGLMSWLRSPICYYNRTEYIHTRPIYYCRIYSDLAWVRHVLGESSSRMSIQIENDHSSSVSLRMSRYGLMVIMVTAYFSLTYG